jgi:hypothetical protein
MIMRSETFRSDPEVRHPPGKGQPTSRKPGRERQREARSVGEQVRE